MQIGTRMILRTLAVSALTVVLGSCGNGSKTYRSTSQPLAVAHFIGLMPTSAAGADPAVATARSQSQVTLTGNASDGVDSAITGFAWSQTDSDPAVQVTLLYASADTITFTAPKVPVDNTPLHFLLTITTANGKTASAHATVMIKAIGDPNQFLALPAASPTPILHRFKVAVATLEGRPSCSVCPSCCSRLPWPTPKLSRKKSRQIGLSVGDPGRNWTHRSIIKCFWGGNSQ